VPAAQVDDTDRVTGERFQKMKKSGKLTIVTLGELRKLRKKAARG
jgi:hypothetical protein